MKGLILKIGFCLIICHSSIVSGANNDTTAIHLYLEQSKSLQKDLKTDSAFFFANKALLLAKKINNKKEVGASLQRIGSLYFSMNQIDSAIYFFKNALSIREESKEFKDAIASCINLKHAYSNLSQFDKAFEVLFQALRINNRLNDSSDLAEIYIELGNLFIDYNDLNKALFYLLKAEIISRKINHVELQIFVNSALGNYYFNKAEHSVALKYFLNTEKLILSFNKNKQLLAITFNNIALCYVQLKKYENASSYYHKGLVEYLASDMQFNVANTYFNLAVMFNTERMPDSAIFYLQKSLKIAEAIKDLKHEALCNENLADAYALKKDFEKAYEFHIRSSSLNDSLMNAEKISSISEMQTKYETEKKEAQIIILDEQNRTKSQQRNFFIAGMILFILLAGSVFMGLMKTSKEKKKSDILLLNILPEEVADELKMSGTAEAKLFDEVTVLFTDFKGFTAMAEKLTPKELVKDIHECFSEFDRIMEKHGMEKIKTIGDAYMAAGGLPTPNKTHAQDAIYAALEIIRFIEEGKALKMASGEPYFDIRIGIHTGPVVAGIVGVKKFAYDIWGDTVNTASRMESSGEAGKVNISGTTYELVKEQFECSHRGKISAKGKGEIDMYFVNRSFSEG